MSSKKSIGGINQGYTKYSKDKDTSSLTTTNNQTETTNSSKKTNQRRYPKGYFSLFLICVATVIVFLISYLTTAKNNPNDPDGYYHLCWQYASNAAFGVGFLCNLMWLYSRMTVGMNSKSRYTASKMIDLMTFKPIRQKRNWVWINNDIKTQSDYEMYCKQKKKTTALVFYISISAFTLLLIISIILSFTTVKDPYVLAS